MQRKNAAHACSTAHLQRQQALVDLCALKPRLPARILHVGASLGAGEIRQRELAVHTVLRNKSRCRCGQRWAQSRCRCGRGEPSPGAAVGRVSPVPVQMRQGVSPVPVQMRQGVSPVPVQMWQREIRGACAVLRVI